MRRRRRFSTRGLPDGPVQRTVRQALAAQGWTDEDGGPGEAVDLHWTMCEDSVFAAHVNWIRVLSGQAALNHLPSEVALLDKGKLWTLLAGRAR